MRKCLSPVLGILFVAGFVQAAPSFMVNGVATGQTVSSVTEGSANYWAGNSHDSTNSATVGNFLTGTGAFAGHPSSPNIALANLRAFQNAGGTAYDSLKYNNDGVTAAFTIKIEVAGLAGANQLWYRQGSKLARIFDGAAGENQTVSITITGEFEFYLIRGITGTEYNGATDINSALYASGVEWARSANDGSGVKTRKSGTTSNKQSFATFQDTNNTAALYTGIEDLWPPDSSDDDYNDLILSMILEVPAPPAIVLAALGIPALGLVRRWTRKTPADAVGV